MIPTHFRARLRGHDPRSQEVSRAGEWPGNNQRMRSCPLGGGVYWKIVHARGAIPNEVGPRRRRRRRRSLFGIKHAQGHIIHFVVSPGTIFAIAHYTTSHIQVTRNTQTGSEETGLTRALPQDSELTLSGLQRLSKRVHISRALRTKPSSHSPRTLWYPFLAQ